MEEKKKDYREKFGNEHIGLQGNAREIKTQKRHEQRI